MLLSKLARCLARQHAAERHCRYEASTSFLQTHAETCSTSECHTSPLRPIPTSASASGLWRLTDAVSPAFDKALPYGSSMSMRAGLGSRCLHTNRRIHDAPQPSAAATSSAGVEGPKGQSMDAQEVAKFEAMASEWWNPEGPNGALHTMNPLRTQFARDAICLAHGREARTVQPLRDLSVLDVGCGGGLFSEALARLGADVTGVDTSATAISVATMHAQADPAVGSRTRYQNATAEQLQLQGAQFDAVVASEVIEHVSNVPEFCASLVALTRPGGSIVVSTINRTNRSYAVAIVGAEQIMGLLPKGTHQWERFITPEDLCKHMEKAGANRIGDSGMVMNPFTGQWTFSADKAVNYIMSFRRPADARNPQNVNPSGQ